MNTAGGISVGDILNRTTEAIRENVAAVLIFLAITIPATALSEYLTGGNDMGFSFGLFLSSEVMAQGVVVVLVVLLEFLLGIIAAYYLTAAMVFGTTAPGFDRLLAYVGIYLLSILAITFAAFLLLIPAIILGVRWAPLLPIVVQGRCGATESFGEAWRATSGSSWPIFFAMLVVWVGMMFVAIVFGISSVFGGGTGSITQVLASAMIEAILQVVLIAISVGIFQLVTDKPDDLIATFE
ncbi:MAG: hypothetical protein SXU28_11095 [Pseudomonadota bacterium]|nr:hypothetical protein [Pseudomonadota bacterium]